MPTPGNRPNQLIDREWQAKPDPATAAKYKCGENTAAGALSRRVLLLCSRLCDSTYQNDHTTSQNLAFSDSSVRQCLFGLLHWVFSDRIDAPNSVLLGTRIYSHTIPTVSHTHTLTGLHLARIDFIFYYMNAISRPSEHSLGLGVQFLLQVNAQLGSGLLQLIQVSLVLLLVFNLVLQRLEGSDGSRVVVDSSASLQCLLDHRRSWNQIVGETVVQHSLHLKQVVGVLELLLVSAGLVCGNVSYVWAGYIPGGELLKSLLLVLMRRVHSDLREGDSGHGWRSKSWSSNGSGSGRTDSGGDHCIGGEFLVRVLQ